MGMANKKKKAKAIVNEKHWKPEKAGESIEGKFIGFYQGMFNPNLVLEVQDGKNKTEKVVPIKTVLKNRLQYNDQYKLLKPGVKVKVVYEGEGKGKKGRKSKIYDIYINGKRLDSEIGSIQIDVNKMFK